MPFVAFEIHHFDQFANDKNGYPLDEALFLQGFRRLFGSVNSLDSAETDPLHIAAKVGVRLPVRTDYFSSPSFLSERAYLPLER